MAFRFQKSDRLLTSFEFQRVYESGMHAADDTLVVIVSPNSLAISRLGLAVSRKAGNAVMRNFWKRRIREAFRTTRSDFPIGLDIVVRPRKGGTPDSRLIHQSLSRLINKASKKTDSQSSSGGMTG
ncbi:MAG TPA: ribonuclease P protein component [Planctomycetaceae bacterium]|nr:ribonuclease P protein component [Planctomycetaceae bacterium]